MHNFAFLNLSKKNLSTNDQQQQNEQLNVHVPHTHTVRGVLVD